MKSTSLKNGPAYVAGGWHAVLDGQILSPIFNSKGAAAAGVDVERRRKAKRSLS